MCGEKLELLRRLEGAFNDGDVEAILAELHPAVEWEEQFIPGLDPVYRGHDEVRRWAATVFSGDEWVSLKGRMEGFTETADAAITVTRIEGVSRSSGVRVPMRVHIVWTFRDGKVVRRQLFQTPGEARAAAGLHAA